jgi:hypothetical protein
MGPPRKPRLTRRNHVPLAPASRGRAPANWLCGCQNLSPGDLSRADGETVLAATTAPPDASRKTGPRTRRSLARARFWRCPARARSRGPGNPGFNRVGVNDRGASNSGRIRAARSDSSSSNPRTESPPGVSRCTVLIRCPRPRSRGRLPTTARRSERRSSRGARRPNAGRCRERARADPSPRDPDLGSDGDQARGRARA